MNFVYDNSINIVIANRQCCGAVLSHHGRIAPGRITKCQNHDFVRLHFAIISYRYGYVLTGEGMSNVTFCGGAGEVVLEGVALPVMGVELEAVQSLL